MPLHNPVAVYDAASNVEAHVICQYLRNAGIEASVVEDMSPGGLYSLGTLDGIHKPQIWVDRDNAETAMQLIVEYEDHNGGDLELPAPPNYCYLCGEVMAPEAQQCPSCGGLLESPEENVPAEAHEMGSNPYASSIAAPAEVSSTDTLRSFKKPLAILFLILLAGPFLVSLLGLALSFLE